jgi:hydroxymethylglutaryl-CoA synthase
MTVGIVGFGCYIPKYRIDRMVIYDAFKAPGEKEMTGMNAVNGGDEDSMTMALEAAENAFLQSGIASSDLNGLYISTCSPPYNEQPMGNYVSLLLNMPADSTMVDMGHSSSAGVTALQTAMDAINSGRINNAMVVAAETRHAIVGSDLESNLGNGAGAVILGTKNTIADIEATHSSSTLFIDRWRGAGEVGVRSFDYRYTREEGYAKILAKTIQEFLQKTKTAIKDYDHVVLQQIDTRMTKAMAKTLGLTPQQMEHTGTIVTKIGDCGSAHVFIGLNAVLEHAKAGQRILVASYGTGNSGVFSLKVKEGIEDLRKKSIVRARGPFYSQYVASSKELNYVDFLRHVGFLERTDKAHMHLPVPPMSPFITRSYKEHFQLIGAECAKPGCGFVNFPPSMRKICVRCGGTEFNNYKISRTGKIVAFSVNYYMPTPLPYPLPLMTLEMDDGKARMSAQGTEWNIEDVQIGAHVELVVRILDRSRGISVYALRARKLEK